MKYTDVFKKPLNKQDVAVAARLMASENSASVSLLTRRLRCGYGKALNIKMLLIDAGVLSMLDGDRQSVILKDPEQAVNAALRQLRKGNK